MAITRANCFKIETAGLLIGWTYFVAFLIGFLAILVSSLIGIYLYIAAGDGVLVALLIFFIMIISLVTTGGLIYLSKEFIEGIKIRKIPQIRRFKYLIGVFVILSFISLITALVGSTQTFRFQKWWDSQSSSTPPLGLEFVAIALVILSLHVAIFVIVDMIHKKFNTIEMGREIYKENSNVNIVSLKPRPREVHIRIPEIDLPPPPPKF